MCGRYSLKADLDDVQRRFEFIANELTYSPRYNIAPTQPVLAVTNGGSGGASYMRWGLTPSWAKDVSVGNRLINARAETVARRNSFRTALIHRRCLVLADGFYEWQRMGNAKRPMRVVMKSGEPFAFAGLWDSWRDPQGEVVRSCTIITTEANELLRPIHDRMPVILPREMESFWLDHDVDDPVVLSDVLVPYPAESMDVFEVSALVNRVTNDGPAVALPLGEQGSSSRVETAQQRLL